MGCVPNKSQPPKAKKEVSIKVATLNYSGITLSPFQFFTSSLYREQKDLDYMFLKTLDMEIDKLPSIRQIKMGQKQDKNKNRRELQFQYFFSTLSGVDKIIKKLRYSPLYRQQAGVQKGVFLTQQQFKSKWDQQWELIPPNQKLKINSVIENQKKFIGSKTMIESNEDKNDLPQQIKFHLRLFDLVVYKVITEYVYENEFSKVIENQGVNKYLDFMANLFGQTFLNQRKKTQLLVKFLERREVDVMFIQEATPQFYKLIESLTPDYRILRNNKYSQKTQNYIQSQTSILFKDKNFVKAYKPQKSNKIFNLISNNSAITQQERDNFMKWEKRLVFVSIDNFIFASIHQTKNSEKDKQKTLQSRKATLKDIQLIRKTFPSKYLVFGGIMYDIQLNQQEQQNDIAREQEMVKKRRDNRDNLAINDLTRTETLDRIQQHYNRFPKNTNHDSSLLTLYKKRTSLQVQFKKRCKRIKQCTSFIFYDKRCYNPNGIQNIYKVTELQDDDLKKRKDKNTHEHLKKSLKSQGYIPNDQHPFSHYIVLTTLKIPHKRQRERTLEEKEEDKAFNFDETSSEESPPSPTIPRQRRFHKNE